MKKGYTLAELLIVMAIIVILALVSLGNFVSRRNRSALTTTASTIGSLLREAQSRSVSQASSTSWGVHFENSTTSTPFFVLFATPYSTSSLVGRYTLPAWVGYATATIAQGSYAEMTFSQISGVANGSSSIGINLLQNSSISSTIRVASSGAISY